MKKIKLIKRIFNPISNLSRKQRFYLMIGIVSFLLVAIPSVIYTLMYSNKAEAAWFNDSWGYRQTVDISSSTALTDYQVAITLDTETLITDGKMQSNCNDIRITDANGNVLPHWIEEGSAPCNNASTKIWTKIPNIYTSGNTIYIYYGNSSASSIGDGNKVFDFFDDFNGSSLDNSKWTTLVKGVGGTFSVSEGAAVLSPTENTISSVNLRSKAGFTNNIVIETRRKQATNEHYLDFSLAAGAIEDYGGASSSWWHTTASSGYYWMYQPSSSDGIYRMPASGAWVALDRGALSIDTSTYAIHKMVYGSNGELSWSYNGTLKRSTSDNTFLATSKNIIISEGEYVTGAGDIQYVDWVRVRKYTSTEPTVNSPTNEEKAKGPVAYWSFDEGYGVIARNSKWQQVGTTSNALTNPSLETNQTTWNYQYGSQGSATRTTEKSAFGQYSLAITRTVAGSEANVYNILSGLQSNTVYYFSTWAWANTPSTACIHTYSAGTNLAYGTVCHSGSGRWERIGGTFTSSAGGAVQLRLAHISSSLNTVYFDGVQVELGSTITPYCDGSLTESGSHSWNGTPHASTSTCTYGTDADVIGSTWKTEDQCISGKCLYFDGTASYVDTPLKEIRSNILDSGMTMAAWIRTNSDGEVIHQSTRTGCTYECLGGIRVTEGKARATIYNGESYINSDSLIDVDDNNWHYVVFVYGTDDYLKLYVDGELQSSTNAGNVYNSAAPQRTYIGVFGENAAGSFTNYFKGSIDEPKIYNYERSAEEIRADYASRGSVKGVSSQIGVDNELSSALSNGLVGYWKMDEATWSGTLADIVDSSGNGNIGTAQGATDAKAYPTTGKFGNGGYFDGVDDYVSVPNNSMFSFGTNDFSISAWVKTNVTSTKIAVGKYSGYDYWLGNNYGATFSISGTQVNEPSNTISDNNWHLITGVRSKGVIYIFVDGKLRNSKANTNSASPDGNLGIGQFGTSGYFWNGLIDEVRIYNRALSPSEVSALYNFAPGPIGYWNFEEGQGGSVADKSGNSNNGTWSGTGNHWDQGKYGKGGTFNGSDDYVDIGNPTSLQLKGALTIGFWAKARNNGVAVGKGYEAYEIRPRWDSVETGGYIGYDTGTYWYSIAENQDMTSAVDSANWNYWTWVIQEGSYAKFYVNGKLIKTINDSHFTIYDNDQNLQFGRRVSPASAYFSGSIDEVKIYNYARTPGQIVEDMNAGHPTGGSPIASQVGYYKFDEGYGETANNSGYGGSILNGAITSATWTNNGKFGKGLSFNGSSSYVTVAENNALDPGTDDWSYGAWFKTTATGAQPIIYKYTSTEYYSLRVNNGQIQSGLRVDDTYVGNRTTESTYNDGKWHHVMVSCDRDGNMNLYVDNVLKDSDSLSSVSGLDLNNSADLLIGYVAGSYFSGLIDEVKIYNSALTEEQIKLDYNQSKSLVLGSLSDTSQLEGGSVASNSASASYCVPGDNTTCSPPIAEWNFEEGKGGTVNDSSGNNNTGTWYGSGNHWASGKIGKGGIFNSSNSDYVDTGNNSILNLMGSMTVEAWVYPNPGTGQQAIIGGSSNVFSHPFGMYVRHAAGGDIGAWVNPDGTRRYVMTGTIVYGQWHHIVSTWDGTTLNLYLDGKLLSNSFTTSSYTKTFGNTWIGRIPDIADPRYFNGKIDQVRVFDYARTPAQVAWDYNNGKPVGHWKMDECQGTTINDSSGNKNHGTLTVGATGDQTTAGTCSTPSDGSGAWYNGKVGKYNYSMSFDGLNDYVNVVDNDILDARSHDITVAAWFNADSLTTGRHTIAAKVTGNPTNGPSMGDGWIIHVHNNNILRFTVTDGANNFRFAQFDITGYTGWHHVVATWSNSGNIAKLYLNGVLKATNTTSSGSLSDLDNTNSLTVGMFNTASWPYLGKIDDVRIYNYALTSTQIKNVMNQGSSVRWGPNAGTP